MQHHLRLSKTQDFQLIYANGKTWANKLLVLRALPNGSDHNRYGVVVSKRLGKAVKRNRTRRRVREGTRHLHLRIEKGWDIILIARVAAAKAKYRQIYEAIVDLLRRARLLHTERQDR